MQIEYLVQHLLICKTLFCWQFKNKSSVLTRKTVLGQHKPSSKNCAASWWTEWTLYLIWIWIQEPWIWILDQITAKIWLVGFWAAYHSSIKWCQNSVFI